MINKKCVWFMFFSMVVMTGIAMAAQAAAAPAAPAGTSTLTSVLLAALNGAVIGLVGWLAQKKQDDGSHETFDPVQLVMTIIVGAAIGAIAAWRKKSFGDVETWIENSGYVAVAELALKAVWRNASVKLSDVIGSLKQGAANPPQAPSPDPSKPS